MSSWPKLMVLIVYILSSVSAAKSGKYKSINVYEDCQSGKNVRHQGLTTTFSVFLGKNQPKSLDCHYEFEMHNKNYERNYGFHVYIEDMYLRNGDHIQFGKDSFSGVIEQRSPKYSGNKSNLSYFEREDFEFDLWIKITDTSYNPKMNLTITIFKKNCNKDERKSNWRNCPNQNFCINEDFFCDGYHNCPNGADEMTDQCAEKEESGKFNMLSIFGVLALICIGILAIYFLTPLVVLHCKKRSNQRSQNQNLQENELQTFNQAPIVIPSNHQTVSDDKPPDYDEKPPAYEDLFKNQA